MKRVVGYAEFTAKEMEKGKNKDFERQINILIEQHQDNEEWKLQKIFIDMKNDESSKFDIICKEILQNKIDILLIRNFKNFIADIENTISFLKRVKKLNIEVIFIEENISTFSASDMRQIEMMLFIMQEMSKAEKKVIICRNSRKKLKELSKEENEEISTILNCNHTAIISENTYKRVKEKIIENNKKKEENKARKIFGYDYEDGKYVINKEEEKIIKNKIKSQIMKEKWKDENFKKEMIARMKKAKEIKKRQRGNE